MEYNHTRSGSLHTFAFCTNCKVLQTTETIEIQTIVLITIYLPVCFELYDSFAFLVAFIDLFEKLAKGPVKTLCHYQLTE